MVFPFKEKEYPRKSLCSCIVVPLLFLLKFIYIQAAFVSGENEIWKTFYTIMCVREHM